jgi:adenine deaminase
MYCDCREQWSKPLIGGLMTARPAEVLAAELRQLWSKAEEMEWHGSQGFPRLMIFATLTCTPGTGFW